MTKTTFSLRLRLLLLLLLPPLYASAQEWTTRVGEVRKEQATTSRIGRNHAEEGLSDEELAEFLWNFNLADVSTDKLGEFGPHMFRYRLKEWLKMPAKEDKYETD